LLVSVHWLSGLQLEQPIIFADEMGYLGNARYLAGAAHLPDMQDAQFYHFGYSLLLLPAFWLFSDPASIYKAALAINALLMSALYIPLYSILTGVLEVPRQVAVWIALTCCLYPSLILYSNIAWSENAFVPFYALSVVLFGRYLRSKSARDALLFSLVVGLLYTVHPRALPILVLALAYLLVLAVLKVVPKRQLLLSAAAIGLVFFLTRIVSEHLMAIGWAGAVEFSPVRLAMRIVPGSHFKSLILRAAGQGLYLSLATHGLFLLGLMTVAVYVLKRTASTSARRVLAHPRTGVLIFILITATGVFLASVATKVFSLYGVNTVRATNFLYGRYNEASAVLFMAIALVQLWRGRLDGRLAARRALVVTAAIVFLTVLVTFEIHTAEEAAGPDVPWTVEAVNVAGVFPLIDTLGLQEIHLISLVAILSYLAITVMMRFSYQAAMLLLVLLFSWCSLYTERFNLRPAREATRSRLSFVTYASRLGQLADVSYDVAHLDREVFYGSQYLLPKTIFHRFNSRNGEEPPSKVVISGNDWAQARRLDARFVISAADGGTALWVLPGDLQSRLPSPPYEGLALGVEPRFGIQESGFLKPEMFAGAPARWTSGTATLRVPVDPQNPPQSLEIETAATADSGTRLQLLANGTELWNDWIPGAWSNTFDLAQVPPSDVLTVELKSGTIHPPSDATGLTDDSRLGVLLRAIRLQANEDRPSISYVGLTFGTEPVPGFREVGFHPPELFDDKRARWTNGAAKLSVPMDPRHLPQSLEIEASAPGRSATRLQILANGVELWHERIPDHGWSQTFSLEGVELSDTLLLEFHSDTFTPSDSLEGSTDHRILGVMVNGLRLAGPLAPEERARYRNEVE
jgi:hypothetical protein